MNRIIIIMNISDLDEFMLLTNDSLGSFDFDIVSVRQTCLHYRGGFG